MCKYCCALPKKRALVNACMCWNMSWNIPPTAYCLHVYDHQFIPCISEHYLLRELQFADHWDHPPSLIRGRCGSPTTYRTWGMDGRPLHCRCCMGHPYGVLPANRACVAQSSEPKRMVMDSHALLFQILGNMNVVRLVVQSWAHPREFF